MLGDDKNRRTAFDIVQRRPLNSASYLAAETAGHGRAQISNFSRKLNRFDC